MEVPGTMAVLGLTQLVCRNHRKAAWFTRGKCPCIKLGQVCLQFPASVSLVCVQPSCITSLVLSLCHCLYRFAFCSCSSSFLSSPQGLVAHILSFNHFPPIFLIDFSVPVNPGWLLKAGGRKGVTPVAYVCAERVDLPFSL